MGDAWVYVDESQAPYADGAIDGQPFWLGALITDHPIEASLIAGGLDVLKAEAGTQQDKALTRRYFHASKDTSLARSSFCRAVVDARLNATLVATQWFFGRSDSDSCKGAELHQLSTLLSLMAVFDDDFDAVHVIVAQRDKTFEQAHVDNFPTFCQQMQLDALVMQPGLPARFPRIEAQLAKGDHPGIQVCDLVLWSVQRSKPNRLTPTADEKYMRQLNLNIRSAGGAENAAQQHLEADLGSGVRRWIVAPANAPSARQLAGINEAETWLLAQEIADDVHRAAAIAEGSSRLGHLTEVLKHASTVCESAHLEPRATLGDALQTLMEAFLLVCDTLPVFDVTDGAAWARAKEKRLLAAAFLLQKIPLWTPSPFSLGANDVALASRVHA